MKLSLILENDITRRDFLRRGLAGAMALSPLGKILTASGVAPAIVKSVEAGVVKPWTFPFTVMTGTHYGRGGPPMLSNQFSNVNKAAGIVNQLTSSGIKFGTDEDAYFVGDLSPDDFADIAYAANNEEDLELGGATYQVFDEGDSIYLEPYDSSGEYIHVYKNGLPEWVSAYDFEEGENPIQAWWDGYGRHGDEPLDSKSAAIIQKYNLDMSDRGPEYYDGEEYGDDEEIHTRDYESIEPEKYNPRPDDHIYGSSMHQPFESKLNKVLGIR